MSTVSSIVTRALLAGIVVALPACKAFRPPFARLESAVVSDRYQGSPSQANVRVVRENAVVAPSISMRLLKGDSIVTSATTRVVVTFAAGYEVTLDTNTAIFIENPSIFLRFGQAFIRLIRGKADTTRLDTNTPQAVLHDVGTDYLVTVTPRSTMVRVSSGAVEASSRDGRWPRVRYTELEAGEIGADSPPSPKQRISRDRLEAEIQWVRNVERITKILVPKLDSMTEAQARAAAERAGFRVLLVTHRETADIAPGLVVDQTPAAGTREAPNTYISLVLAKAPKRECTVPDITGKMENEAKRLLEAARLAGQATRDQGDTPMVTKQTEKAGSKVACGSVVHYRVGVIG
jgi:PASTA domain-containing protein/FecR-like protein